MKYLNILITLLLCHPLTSQNLPDINSLLSIQPKWSYISEDTNWYRIQMDNNPHLDQYFGTFYHNSLIKDETYYLLEATTGQTHVPPLTEGYLLHKISLETGKPEWIHFDNFYSGNDFVETVFGGNMNFDQAGNIVVNGFKSLDSIKNISFEGFDDRVYVNVMRDVIDNTNGQLLNHRVDLDTSRTPDKLHPGGFGIRRVGNNRQIKHKFENVFEDGFVRNYLHFYDIDEGGIVADSPTFSYKHTTIIDFDAPFISFPNTYYQINENSGVALFGSRDQTQGNVPAELKLVFFDTSNSPNILVTGEKDILNLMPENIHKGSGYVSLGGKNGYFTLSQKVRMPIDSITEEAFIWLQWYDASGNPIQKIDRLQIDDLDMDFISDYTFVDSTLYMLSQKIDGGPSGENIYYLIKSDKNTSLEKLSSFVRPLEYENYGIGFSGMTILDNNDVLFHLNVNYPFGPQPPFKANVSFVCRYDGKDLGLATNVVEEEELNETIYISPNPATDYIWLNNEHNDNIENVIIIDALGVSRPIELDNEQKIDVSGLHVGNYFVRLNLNGELIVLPFVKI